MVSTDVCPRGRALGIGSGPKDHPQYGKQGVPAAFANGAHLLVKTYHAPFWKQQTECHPCYQSKHLLILIYWAMRDLNPRLPACKALP